MPQTPARKCLHLHTRMPRVPLFVTVAPPCFRLKHCLPIPMTNSLCVCSRCFFFQLIDFGVSARFHEGMKMSERVGTVYTMAPEVLQGEYTEQVTIKSCSSRDFECLGFSRTRKDTFRGTRRKQVHSMLIFPSVVECVLLFLSQQQQRERKGESARERCSI